MVSGGLDGAGADREAVEAEGGVVHAVDAAGKVGPFGASDLRGLRCRWREAIEGGQDRERPEREQLSFPSGEPGRRLGWSGEARGGDGGEVLGGVVEVGDL